MIIWELKDLTSSWISQEEQIQGLRVIKSILLTTICFSPSSELIQRHKSYLTCQVQIPTLDPSYCQRIKSPFQKQIIAAFSEIKCSLYIVYTQSSMYFSQVAWGRGFRNPNKSGCKICGNAKVASLEGGQITGLVSKRNGTRVKKRGGMEGSKGSTLTYSPFPEASCPWYCMQHSQI